MARTSMLSRPRVSGVFPVALLSGKTGENHHQPVSHINWVLAQGLPTRPAEEGLPWALMAAVAELSQAGLGREVSTSHADLGAASEPVVSSFWVT